MSHYTTDVSLCRVDFFRPQGRWYTTESVRWLSYSGISITDAFKEALCAHFDAESDKSSSNSGDRLRGMVAVCLDPYHEHSHPVMLERWRV